MRKRGKNGRFTKQPKIKKICQVCKKSFYVQFCHKNRKYCSDKCYWEKLKGKPSPKKGTKTGIIPINAIKKGQHLSPATEFKNGQISWNKGKKYRIKDGKRIMQGYLYLFMPDHPYVMKSGYIKNANLVMEKKIGRHIKSPEVIHHINGDKLDDRIENLYLCKDRAEHLNIHRKSFHKKPHHQ